MSTQINPRYGRKRRRRSRSQNKDGMEMEWRNIEQPPRKGKEARTATDERKEDRVADGILDLATFLGEKIPVAPVHLCALT